MANEVYVVLAEEAEKKFDDENYGFRAANRRYREWYAYVELKPQHRHRWNHGVDKQTHRPKKGRRVGVKGY